MCKLPVVMLVIMQTNNIIPAAGSVVMYVDMNSFFASCEQQEHPELRGKPIGVITHPSAHACVIAPSVEAKKYGIKTGMRLPDCKLLCPQMIPVVARPYIYRMYHVKIMGVLKEYCEEVTAKSIDEAVMNMTSYKLVYHDFKSLAQQIKADLAIACGDFVKCSIGISANSFLAKLATEIQKPDGLIEITPENIDDYLKQMKLTDLPGIAKANERRLKMIGINDPYAMRHASEALLRKAFGGVVGNYWHRRLNFYDKIDLHSSDYKAMSAARMVSRVQRENRQALESLLISLCTRLEQRMVKQNAFCREVHFYIRFIDLPGWETKVRLNDATQDAFEIRKYIIQQMETFEKQHRFVLFNNKVQHMGVTVASFIHGDRVQYGLFDNKIKQDEARKIMYQIKDKYGRDIVRKAVETIYPHEMRDAIGFGSVKDFMPDAPGADSTGKKMNQYLLQDDGPPPVPKHVLELRERKKKALEALNHKQAS